MAANEKFFEKLQKHSEIKLRILGDFLVPWASKLGAKVRTRGHSQLWYLDGFAGPGRYKDGSEGSPIVGATRVYEVLLKKSGHTLGCINVEKDRPKFQLLQKNLAGFSQRGVPIHNIHGSFSEEIARITDLIGERSPLLAFVDPFGVAPLDFDLMRPLLSRPGEIDVIMTFNHRSIRRLKDRPDLILRAIGSSAGDAGLLTQEPAAIIAVLKQNLIKVGRFKDVVSYGVRGAKGRAAKYQLVMASRNYEAFELLNNIVCAAEDRLEWNASSADLQEDFFDLIDSESDRHELVRKILEYGRSHKRTTKKRIREHIVMAFCMGWRVGDINRAVKFLIDIGRIRKLDVGRIDTAHLEFLSS